MGELKITYRKVEELVPYAKNPRKNKEAVDYVARSIKEFGFKNPIIIDKDDTIVAGHTRLLAAKKLKMEEVPCITADDLTEEQIKAFRLADNKTGEFADWDDDLLGQELAQIFDIDMESFGFFADDEEKNGNSVVDEEEIGEEDFTAYIDETSQYIVLTFNTEADWNNAISIFGIKPVKQFSTRKDGKENGVTRTGIGRVIDGATAIKNIGQNFKDMGL